MGEPDDPDFKELGVKGYDFFCGWLCNERPVSAYCGPAISWGGLCLSFVRPDNVELVVPDFAEIGARYNTRIVHRRVIINFRK